MPWVTPVSDRTQEDVEYAIFLISEWRSLAEPGATILTEDLKGCFNYKDMNRIEGNLRHLTGEANRIRPGTPLDPVTKLDWDRTSVPSSADIDRIIQAIGELKERVHVVGGPSLPTSILSYEDANAIEEALEWCKSNLAPLGNWQNASEFTWGDLASLTWGDLT